MIPHMDYSDEEFIALLQSAQASNNHLRAFADWYENLWDEGTSFFFPDSDLVFTLTRREHIGEGYVDVHRGNQHLGTLYEQLGLLNVHRAKLARSLTLPT